MQTFIQYKRLAIEMNVTCIFEFDAGVSKYHVYSNNRWRCKDGVCHSFTGFGYSLQAALHAAAMKIGVCDPHTEVVN